MSWNPKLLPHAVITQGRMELSPANCRHSQRLGNYCILINSGARFPFSWPELNHSWALFWLLLSNFVQNSPRCSSNMTFIPQKCCITHSCWCSREEPWPIPSYLTGIWHFFDDCSWNPNSWLPCLGFKSLKNHKIILQQQCTAQIFTVWSCSIPHVQGQTMAKHFSSWGCWVLLFPFGRIEGQN